MLTGETRDLISLWAGSMGWAGHRARGKAGTVVQGQHTNGTEVGSRSHICSNLPVNWRVEEKPRQLSLVLAVPWGLAVEDWS